jgi:hypothetical protein
MRGKHDLDLLVREIHTRSAEAAADFSALYLKGVMARHCGIARVSCCP